MRTLRKEDHDGHFISKYDLTHLKMILLVGERTDIPGYNWLRTHVRKDMLVNDNYWQTETGWPISTNYLYLHRFDETAGSCGRPTPGNQVVILGEDGKPVPPKTLGRVFIKLPMPPSFMSTLYGNDEAFKKKYLDEVPGYYSTGDAGYLDDKGFLHVTTRVDDIINTAGHRLSTSQMEEVLTHHNDIVEAAVVPGKDEIKGEIPIGFVVLKSGSKKDPIELEKECIKKVRNDIGAVASFKKCIIVEKLPKTRSGKIVRNVLKALVNGDEPKIPPTIEDVKVVEDVRKAVKKAGLGKHVDIEYEEDVKK
jgi:propionyl-CoA synthetase